VLAIVRGKDSEYRFPRGGKGGGARRSTSGSRAGMPECASLCRQASADALRRVKSGALGRGEAELLLAALAEHALHAADGGRDCVLAAALEGADPPLCSVDMHRTHMHPRHVATHQCFGRGRARTGG